MRMLSRNLQNLIKLRTFCSSNKKIFDWKEIKYKTKVPQQTVKSQFSEKTERIKITEDEIFLLEKLSLVDLERKYVNYRLLLIKLTNVVH